MNNISKTFSIICLFLIIVANGLAPAEAKNIFKKAADKTGDVVRSGAREVLTSPKETVYRTNPYYIALVQSLKVAKRQNVIRNRTECHSVADNGSTAAGGAAMASGVGTAMSVVVKTIGKDAGYLACKDVF